MPCARRPAARSSSATFRAARIAPRCSPSPASPSSAPRERRDLLEATEESFDELISTNLKGPHFLTQQAARWMAETNEGGAGRIAFVTSISAYTASVNRGEYCISKAALSMTVALY